MIACSPVLCVCISTCVSSFLVEINLQEHWWSEIGKLSSRQDLCLLPPGARRCYQFQIISVSHFGIFSRQRVNINLSSRPEWDQTSGWSLRRNVITLDIIIRHFIIIFVTDFFNPEPHPRWRGFILMPFSVRWFYLPCPLFTDLNVRVIGWTSSPSNSSSLGFLFFFKTI